MFNSMRRILVIATFVCSLVATGAAARPPQTEVQKAMGRCVASVAGGAILGALLGGASGRNNAGRGAIVGAAVGAGFCGVMLKMASDRDKSRIAQAQAEAAESGQAQDVQYVGDDGAARQIQVSVRDAPTPPATDSNVDGPATVCRYVDTTLTVAGSGQANVPNQLVCRTPDGNWLPHSNAA
jgi:hypothetical protein